MTTQIQVRVHRRGRDPEKSSKMETVTRDSEGVLWTHDGKRWWKLSREAPGGWHSINVGYPIGFEPK